MGPRCARKIFMTTVIGKFSAHILGPKNIFFFKKFEKKNQIFEAQNVRGKITYKLSITKFSTHILGPKFFFFQGPRLCAEKFQLSYCCKIFRAHFRPRKKKFLKKFLKKNTIFLTQNVRGKFYNNMIIGNFPRTFWVHRIKLFMIELPRVSHCFYDAQAHPERLYDDFRQKFVAKISSKDYLSKKIKQKPEDPKCARKIL